MRGFEDDNGQLILIACVTIVIAIVLMTSFEYSTLCTGGKSINRENMNSAYYYKGLRERYIHIYENPEYLNFSSSKNLYVFEREIKDLAHLHGYSVDFIHNGTKTTIVFVDKDMRIVEELT